MGRRLKLARRIRNPFSRNSSEHGQVSGHDDDRSIVSVGSNVSVTSEISVDGSLNSSIRNHGPIDVDNCRRYKQKRTKKKRTKKQTGRDGGLPKIAENPSPPPSSPIAGGGSDGSTPVNQATNESGTSTSQVKPSPLPSPGSQSILTANGKDVFERGRTSPPTTSSPVAEKDALVSSQDPDESPGAQTTSTIDGQDVFERGRSYMTSLADSLVSPEQVATSIPIILNLSTDGSMLFAGLESKDELSQKDGDDGVAANNSGEQREVQDNSKPSPTSVLDMFDFDEDKYALAASAQQDTNSLKEPPALPQPRPTQAAKGGEQKKDQPSSNPAPSKMFTDAYSSLEDAVAKHLARLSTVNIGGVRDGDRREDASKGTFKTDIAGPATETDPTGDASNPDFLALKKIAEKNEFKKVVVVIKRGEEQPTHLYATLPELQETIEIRALDTPLPGNLNKIVHGDQAALLDEKRAMDPPGERGEKQADPPGLGTIGTRSLSPEPPSPNSFLDETRSTTMTPPPPPPPPPPSPPPLSPPDIGQAVTVDVIQSFSFEQDNGLQYSLSEDTYSFSYVSDIESIGDITIDEETTRLLEAWILYDDDALTNEDHPSRRKKSIMKVGSRFQMGGSSRSIGDRESPPTCPEIPTDVTIMGSNEEIEMMQQNNKLTWYDDEENWDKPFTLRTDESFDDATTVVSAKDGVNVRVNAGVQNMERIIRQDVVPNVNRFLGDVYEDIRKYTECGSEDDASSLDVEGGKEV